MLAGRLQPGAKELAELSRTYKTHDGNIIRGRVFARQLPGQEVRYEILVDGFGQYAVVDARNVADLNRLMAPAMDAFAMSARLRGCFSVSL